MEQKFNFVKFIKKYSKIYFDVIVPCFLILSCRKRTILIITDFFGVFYKVVYLREDLKMIIKVDRDAILAFVKNEDISKKLMIDTFDYVNSSKIIINEISTYFGMNRWRVSYGIH